MNSFKDSPFIHNMILSLELHIVYRIGTRIARIEKNKIRILINPYGNCAFISIVRLHSATAAWVSWRAHLLLSGKNDIKRAEPKKTSTKLTFFCRRAILEACSRENSAKQDGCRKGQIP
ncbi:MAG: hypothetical protein PUG80_05645 [Eubacteriales bacterium]|nr:hypothetical protein [Eubacteriales bacterium]